MYLNIHNVSIKWFHVIDERSVKREEKQVMCIASAPIRRPSASGRARRAASRRTQRRRPTSWCSSASRLCPRAADPIRRPSRGTARCTRGRPTRAPPTDLRVWRYEPVQYTKKNSKMEPFLCVCAYREWTILRVLKYRALRRLWRLSSLRAVAACPLRSACSRDNAPASSQPT